MQTESMESRAQSRTSAEVAMPQSAFLRNAWKPEGKKRGILVVEDSDINREILNEMLQDEFCIFEAENGEEGIRMLKKLRDQLSLILLDVYMPVCTGFEFLERRQKDPYLSSVPVIVTTGSDTPEDEEKCLQLGATDFITKPYNLETMLGRIYNVIRLKESLSALSVVEFDRVTGLYTMSAFLHHAAQILAEQSGAFNLGMLRIQEFPSINRIHGEAMGDKVLRFLAEQLKEKFPEALLARQGDNFVVLEAAGKIDGQAVENTIAGLIQNAPVPNLRVRAGIYLDVDRNQPVSVLCDRAKLAVDSKGRNADSLLSYYDAALEQKHLEQQKLRAAFAPALEKHEFVVWVQPKVDLQTDQITAGEALVRWIDSEGTFLNPGAFIPLFEREGQIRQLDEYIFRTVCAYQSARQKAGKKIVPISINLSRNSLFREGIVDIYRRIAEEEGIDLFYVPIEITESAATSEKEIQGICDAFAEAGFHLQMDDFGTGYSSMSALAALPFEVIKLDKSIIDRIGAEKTDIVIRNLIDMAHELRMKVVAEGVEEADQAEYLTRNGCDQIQGYFFSPPKKLPLFEELLEKEEPFKEKTLYRERLADDVMRISSAQLSRELRNFRILFSAVRILGMDCKTYRSANMDGSLQEARIPCYEIWKRGERCENCITMKSLQTRKTMHKFEVFEDEVYSVYSTFVEVDGVPRVIELLNKVGEDVLHGYPSCPTMLEMLRGDVAQKADE